MLRSAILIFAVFACLAGCGQKGPLYLPHEPASAGRATLVQTLTPGKASAPASAASAAAPAPTPAPPPPESIFE
jgi:predicted small lipoprotein YifL